MHLLFPWRLSSGKETIGKCTPFETEACEALRWRSVDALIEQQKFLTDSHPPNGCSCTPAIALATVWSCLRAGSDE